MSANFNVTVLDTISPNIVGTPTTVSIVPDLTSCSATVSWSMPSATDNCSATLTSSAMSGSTFAVGTHTVTFTATDLSGNVTISTLTFTVTDMVAPTLTNVPSDTTLYSDVNTCGAMVDLANNSRYRQLFKCNSSYVFNKRFYILSRSDYS